MFGCRGNRYRKHIQKMDSPKTSGGLWSCARGHTYSQKTQELLKLMMQESYLANGQKRQIRECLKNGSPLHLVSNPPPPPPQSKPTQATSRRLPNKPQKRSADQCKAGDSYVREKFKPGPARDHEKEKLRLQKILEMGKDEPKVTIKQHPPISEAPEQKDRSEEILEEIEERRQFLEDMASLGQEQQYVNVINTEISQRIRELELLNESSSQTSERG